MVCNNINFTTELIETTENTAIIRVVADKYYECVSVKTALYNQDNQLLQDFITELTDDNIVDITLNIPITSEVCKIRVRLVQCCPDTNCDPSTVVCDPGLVLDPGSCLCIDPPVCAQDPQCNIEPCLWNSTIKGYIFYRHSYNSVNIPDIGELHPPCFGGHICDGTVFMPKLQLGNGTIISANKTVSINNWEGPQSPTPVPGWTPISNYDRSDIFEFEVENTEDLVNAQVFLDCAYSICHNGAAMVALVAYCDELQTHKLIFFSCLGSGQVEAKPMFNVECNATTYAPCDPLPPSPQPPQPTPSLSDFYCASVSTSEEDCAPKEPVTDPYIKPADQYINQSFNDVYIPRRVNLNISQNGCDVVARFCAISCRDGIPPSASPTPTPTPTPTSTPTPTPTPTSSNTPTPTPTPSITPSPCSSPSVTPSNTPTRTPTRTPTPSPSVTRTPTPTPSTSMLVGCRFDYMPYISLSDLPILSNITNKNVPLDIDLLCGVYPYLSGDGYLQYTQYLNSIGITFTGADRSKPQFDSRYTLFQLFMQPNIWYNKVTGYKLVELNINGKCYDNQSQIKIDGSPLDPKSYLFMGNFNTATDLRNFVKTKINFGPGWPYNDLFWTPAIINKPYFSPINSVYCTVFPC